MTTPTYDDLRRLVVGEDSRGYPVSIRCFISEDGSVTVSKYYIGRFTTPYGQEIVHRLHDSLQPIGDTPEEMAKTMRCAWFRKFNYVSQDRRVEISVQDETKRMHVANTLYHEEIWATWGVSMDNGELVSRLAFWKSPTSFAKSHQFTAIDNIIDLNTLVPTIQTGGVKEWRAATLNLLATRYRLEDPPEDMSKAERVAKKRAMSRTPSSQRGAAKKPRMKHESNVEASPHSTCSTPRRPSLPRIGST